MKDSYEKVVNVSFCYRVKMTRDLGPLVLPAVNKQLGVNINYIVIAVDEKYSGLYAWQPPKKFKTWKNKTLECYVIPLDELQKIASIEDLDEETSLGAYILRIIRKMRDEDAKKRN